MNSKKDNEWPNPLAHFLSPLPGRAGGPIMIALALLWTARAFCGDFQGAHHLVEYDGAPFYYSKTTAQDGVAQLAQRLEDNEISLSATEEHGYLEAFLRACDISPASQVLVFSKTSLHRDLISPEQPRAIYFNDDVYVGWVPWAPVLEISAVDKSLGGVFYALPQDISQAPRLTRNHTCVECHVSRFTMGVPGHLIRSVVTDEAGLPSDLTSGEAVTHRLPYAKRRGGWFVTGTHGRSPHLGNLVGADEVRRQEREPNFHGNLTELSQFFDTGRYLRSGSDIVALMVLEHQVHMHNFLARLHYEARLRLAQYGHIRYVHAIADGFLKYLLFAEEAPLEFPVRGDEEFSRQFEQRGPQDHRGRSLREFDLQTRLFKYPCSYLIYSEAFDGLPQLVKDYVYERLLAILSNRDDGGEFEHLRTSTRRAILEILRETKPDFRHFAERREQAKTP